MKKSIFDYSLFRHFALLLICGAYLFNTPLHAAKKSKQTPEDSYRPAQLEFPKLDQGKGYTANFTNVSIIEVIKFLSKISDVNFIYNEAELAFAVSIVSEEPTSASDLMAAFLQVLRINGFTVLEEGKNLVVAKSAETSRIATIISPEHPYTDGNPPPIITRVYPIKNANPSSLATVVKTMLSSEALVEVSAETRHLIVTDVVSNIEKITALLQTLDAPSTPLEIDAYSAKNISPVNLVLLATQIITPLAEGNPVIMVPQEETSTIFIVSTGFLIDKTLAVLEDLDTVNLAKQTKILSSENIYMYKAVNRSPMEIVDSLREISGDLQGMGFLTKGLIDTISAAKPITRTDSILFVGDPATLNKLKELLIEIDQVPQKGINDTYLIYKIKNATAEQMQKSLDSLLKNLQTANDPDQELMHSIETMKWIQETDSLVFTGKENALEKLNDILVTFDVPPETSKAPLSQTPQTEFFIYKPKHRNAANLIDALQGLVNNLQSANLANPSLLNTIEGAKQLPNSGNIVFTGDQKSLDKVKTLMATIDTTPSALEGDQKVFIYKLKYVDKTVVEDGLNNFAASLPEDASLQETIKTMNYIPQSRAFVFKGSPQSIDRIKEVIEVIDTEGQAKVVQSEKATYSIYRLKFAQGDVILNELDKVAKNVESSGVSNQNLVEALKSVQWNKQTNSLFITGKPQIIDQIKAIIEDYDVEESKGIEAASNFFIYKPKNQSPEEMQVALSTIAADLEEAGLADPALINALRTMRFVQTSGTLVFAGSPATIAKVKELLSTIDVTAQGIGVQQVGQTTFLVYKIRNQSATQLLSSLRSVASDMEKSDNPDRSLIKSINGMRFVKENNSILFLGAKPTLQKIETLLQKFDTGDAPVEKIPTSPRVGAEVFFIYKPKYQAGEHLIETVKEFEQNLIESGVQTPNLFDTINHLKWMPKTSSIVVSGDNESVEKVKELLEKFDMPSPDSGKKEPTIETFDDMSFLIYKVQFHKGNEIESALQKLAIDFKKDKVSDKNQKLVEAINSIQWIQVTNSLVTTGDPQTLSKLKELLKSIDVPLRQVFIEVLVIETSLTNSLTFGLRWGSQGKYLNKFGYATGNFPNAPASGTDPLAPFATNLAAINGTDRFPTGSDVPFTTGAWDLGIIGDLIFHKGKTYFALGSLIDAVQNDTESTVVLNQKLITQDNKTSTVFVGSNLPYTGSVVQNSGQNTTVTNQNLEYRDIGVNLTITPTLGDDDIITLEIIQDITEQIANPVDTNNQGENTSIQVFGIATSKNSTNTSVHVPDRHFVAISGQVRDTRTKTKTGVPCLGGLPLIGLAFSENNTLTSKNNVIIFIRPHIVDTARTYKAVTEKQEEVVREQAPDREFFDAGIDLVKTPENE